MSDDEQKILTLPEPSADAEDDKIRKRQKQQKAEIIELLKKTPIVQIACERSGVGRATFYRWKKDDSDFAQAVDEAIQTGSALVNDMAESQLMSGIRDGNFSAVAFWLKNNHPRYRTRVEISTQLNQGDQPLNEEQEKLLDRALKIAALGSAIGKEPEHDNTTENDKR